jgi:uncharacterized membrane protein
MILGLMIFLGMHSVSIVAAPLRNSLAAKSEILWKVIYGVVSIVGLVLVIRGYADARLTSSVLYTTPGWMNHVVALLMLPAFSFFIAPYFPGKISATLKHPQLVAVKLWALSHLLVNGRVAELVLFGAFLAWAVVDRISLKKREQKPMLRLPTSGFNDIIVVVLGLGLYLAFVFHLHRAWIGVSPMGAM